MSTDPLVKAVLSDPEGRAEWSATRIRALLDDAGIEPDDFRAGRRNPSIKVGQILARHPAFTHRVIKGRSLWRLK